MSQDHIVRCGSTSSRGRGVLLRFGCPLSLIRCGFRRDPDLDGCRGGFTDAEFVELKAAMRGLLAGGEVRRAARQAGAAADQAYVRSRTSTPTSSGTTTAAAAATDSDRLARAEQDAARSRTACQDALRLQVLRSAESTEADKAAVAAKIAELVNRWPSEDCIASAEVGRRSGSTPDSATLVAQLTSEATSLTTPMMPPSMPPRMFLSASVLLFKAVFGHYGTGGGSLTERPSVTLPSSSIKVRIVFLVRMYRSSSGVFE